MITEIVIVAISVSSTYFIVKSRLTQKAPPKNLTFEYVDFEELRGEVEVTSKKQEVNFSSPQPDLLKIEGEVKVRSEVVENVKPDLDVKYTSPRTELLTKIPHVKSNEREVEQAKKAIQEKLLEYGIEIKTVSSITGPSVTLYKLLPNAGVKVSQITNLSSDLALALSCSAVMVYPIQGDNKIGVEVPNKKPSMVGAREVFESDVFTKSKYELPICLGKLVDGSIKVMDLATAPHLLIAGATGKGKSVGINMLIASLIFKKHPDSLKFVMIDPKRVELSTFEGIEKQFLLNLTGEDEAIITDVHLAQSALERLCSMMDERYDILKAARVRNIVEYNEKSAKKMFYIVVVIDELADLMMTAGKGIEVPLCRLAQLARAIGIHLIVATQRPSAKILTGDIKTNFPTRWSFQVSSGVDSKIILDTVGAENLIGKGDSLLSNSGGKLERIQCAYIDTKEVNKLVDFIEKQPVSAVQIELTEVDNETPINAQDERLDEAIELCKSAGKCNVTFLRSKMGIGHSRAEKLVKLINEMI